MPIILLVLIVAAFMWLGFWGGLFALLALLFLIGALAR
jgi:hypothetical protein